MESRLKTVSLTPTTLDGILSRIRAVLEPYQGGRIEASAHRTAYLPVAGLAHERIVVVVDVAPLPDYDPLVDAVSRGVTTPTPTGDTRDTVAWLQKLGII